MKHEDKYGAPDITLAGLSIWVHGLQFPNAKDYWDGNWLNVTAQCSTSGARVWVNGSIITLPEISSLVRESEKLYSNMKGKASLSCMEPYLSFALEASGLGQIRMTVNITPDQLTQTHEIMFEIDQSYLPKFIQDCKLVLEKYPIKGKP